ncbi:MAG TPA: two-component regulator propeller domain-containing protein, partial [Parafilimonas sp.]|nr:two-component regulator propeller domain-containing protein [Parafilimonas sp.]
MTSKIIYRKISLLNRGLIFLRISTQCLPKIVAGLKTYIWSYDYRIMNHSWFHNHNIFVKAFIKIFFLSICFLGNVSGQEDVSLSSLRFDHLNFSNGLSFNVVNSIIKDKKGFIWISTQDGLNRYDGVNFKVYRHDAHNPNSLASSGVYQMTLDSKGNIWMATDAALTEYVPATDSFKNFFVATRSKSRSTQSPYVDSDDVVWFGDNDGLCRLNSDGEIETFPIKHLLRRFSIGSIIEDDEGIIWVGTIQGLYSFNKQTHIFKRYSFKTGSEEANSITCLIQDHEKDIWVGSWGNGIAKFDRRTGKFEVYKYSVDENIVWSIYESSEQEGKLWIGTAYQGIAIFDKEKKSFEFASINPNDVNAFNAYGVNQIFNDHLGTLWFAGTNGVVKLDKYKQQFRRQIVEPIRTSTGKGITGIIADTLHAQKLLWVSTYRHGIIAYSQQTGKFTVFGPHPGNAISNQLVNSMVQDHDGKFWIATSNGFNRFDPETKIFSVFKNIPGKNSLPVNDINHLMLSKEGKVWMTVRGNGFCSFDPQTQHFNWYRKISDQNNDSINNSVFCLTEDHNGVIWGGTQFGGMFSFNPK